jgi:hypothetical protein
MVARFLSFLGDYFYTVFLGWYGIVVLIFGIVDLCERIFGWKMIIPTQLKVWALISIFIVAQMFAYKDLKEKYETTQPKIEYQDKPETLKELKRQESEIVELKNQITSLQQTNKYQRLTMKPNLHIGFYVNQDGSGWKLSSSGPGVAVIKWFSVYIDKQPKKDWKDFADTIGQRNDFGYSNPADQIVANFTFNLFWMKPQAGSILIQNADRVRMEICYCSLFGDCWLTTNLKAEPTKEHLCKQPPPVTFVRY